MALRVPTGSPDAVRLEHRVAGADANPYLLLAAVLAGVHHGLTNKVEPGAPIEGNSYEQMEPSLPNNLRDALRELDESEIMAKYIDPKYIDIFVACKESELEEFDCENHYIHSFELENGRIKRNREFMNPIQKLRALGIAVPQIKRDDIPT